MQVLFCFFYSKICFIILFYNYNLQHLFIRLPILPAIHPRQPVILFLRYPVSIKNYRPCTGLKMARIENKYWRNANTAEMRYLLLT